MALILIVEDNEPVAETFRAGLEAAGHRTVVVPSANDAAVAALDEAPDLVLMDLALRNSHGATASLALRGLGYRGPIILTTGGLMPVDPRIGDAVGFAAELRKPLTVEELVAAVEKHLGGGHEGAGRGSC